MLGGCVAEGGGGGIKARSVRVDTPRLAGVWQDRDHAWAREARKREVMRKMQLK